MKLKVALLLAVASIVPGCGSGRLLVDQPAQAAMRVHSVALQHQNRIEGVPPSADHYLRAKMDESFFTRDPAFGRGSDIVVRYGFANLERGSPITRVMLGSKTVVEAEIVDQQGKVLSRMRSRHNVKLIGGISYLAIDQSVAEIRAYAVAHFQR